ncbi:MAG: toll/interleukin-1 receptor domain-containing protein, partial [Candidatus Thiodiazotropha sp.]
SETEYFVVPVIALSITVVVLGLILFLILRFRKEVLIILYTRFHIILPCQSRNWNDDKKYDAFVSYSSNDEDFVGSLFERLEQPPEDSNTKAFKFCLHHRDFVLGKTSFSNGCNSVESSRHTIILLSKNFIKSQYCLYEFQEAFRQSIMEKKRHLIIIMMEDVPTEELPTDLRRCIKTFTYIRKDDYLFDDRLIYALSVKQKSKSVNEPKSKTNLSYTNESTNSKAKISQSFDSSEGDSKSKTQKLKSNRPTLTLSPYALLNENFEINNGDLNQKDKVTVVNEMNTINATDVDYDRCISTGSTDTGYGSDFNPSPTSTVCSSPTYVKNGHIKLGENVL